MDREEVQFRSNNLSYYAGLPEKRPDVFALRYWLVDRLSKLCYSKLVYVIVVSVNDNAESSAFILK